jgi:hypothetical protein
MPSCNPANFKTDTTNHPNFTARFNKWREATSCQIGAIDCLTEDEERCVVSYTLDKARSILDDDLTSIYRPDTAITASFDSNYQTTMLTGLVWAALGTTVLYYAFTKI